MDTSIRSCSKCGRPHDRRGQRYCPDCHSAAQRDYRARKGVQETAVKIEAKNLHEAANREKKAQRYVEFIWSVLSPANRIDPETVTVLRRLTPAGWELLAGEAGEKVPSEATRLRIVQVLTQRVKDARFGFDHGRAVA